MYDASSIDNEDNAMRVMYDSDFDIWESMTNPLIWVFLLEEHLSNPNNKCNCENCVYNSKFLFVHR